MELYLLRTNNKQFCSNPLKITQLTLRDARGGWLRHDGRLAGWLAIACRALPATHISPFSFSCSFFSCSFLSSFLFFRESPCFCIPASFKNISIAFA